MEHEETLLSIAEIALGLAGFGGVFVAVGRSRDAERRPADTYRLVLLLCMALATLVLSLVPVALHALGLAGAGLWRVSNALQALVLAVLLVVFRRWRMRHLEEIRHGEAPLVAALIWVLSVATLVAQAASAAGLLQGQAAGIFLTGLVFLVAFGCYLFARMLFLWRS
jgi:hypothetical protein